MSIKREDYEMILNHAAYQLRVSANIMFAASSLALEMVKTPQNVAFMNIQNIYNCAAAMMRTELPASLEILKELCQEWPPVFEEAPKHLTATEPQPAASNVTPLPVATQPLPTTGAPDSPITRMLLQLRNLPIEAQEQPQASPQTQETQGGSAPDPYAY